MVVNGQKMKCELKGSVNMKLQDVKTGETYQSPERDPSCEIVFDCINARIEGCNDGGHSGKNDN